MYTQHLRHTATRTPLSQNVISLKYFFLIFIMPPYVVFPSDKAPACTHPLQQHSLVNALLPATLVSLGLLQNPLLASTLMPSYTRLLLRLDAIRAAAPELLSEGAPMRMAWLVEIERCSLQLVAQVCVCIYMCVRVCVRLLLAIRFLLLRVCVAC